MARQNCGSARVLHRDGRAGLRVASAGLHFAAKLEPLQIANVLCGFAHGCVQVWCVSKGCARVFLQSSAPLLWQRPVDELHWIENTALKNRIVFLTFFPVAVQHTRSLTVSKVFPVGGESGAQASSHRPSTDLEVISETGNGSCRRAGTAVPRCKGGSSCIAFPARRCRRGTKPGASKGDRARRAKLFRRPAVARPTGQAPDAIRRLGIQVALKRPTACQPRTGRPADERHPAMSLRGAARVYSELLVEANRKL